MRVLCIDNSQWWAGAEMCLRDYLLLPDDRCQVDVCVPYPMSHHAQYQLKSSSFVLRDKKLKFWMFESFLNPIKGLDRITKLYRSKKLKNILTNQKYDIVHFNLFRERDQWDINVADNAGCKIVLHIRSLFHQAPYTMETLDKADLIFGTSDAVCFEAQSTGTNTPIRRVYDGVSEKSQNVYDRSEMRRKWGLLESEIVAVFPAVIEPRKGQDVAIQAWEKIVSSHPNAKLVIAGGVPHGGCGFESELNKIAAPAYDSIVFTGHINDIGEMYSLADFVLALSKDGEAFGRIPIEAGLAKLPTIGTRAGATPELIVPHETGLLVEPNDVEQTAEALDLLLSDEKLRTAMGENARSRCFELFSLERGVSDFYEGLLSI